MIEEKYGFNKTTWKTFVSDKFKGYGLTIVLGSAVMVPLLYFLKPMALMDGGLHGH